MEIFTSEIFTTVYVMVKVGTVLLKRYERYVVVFAKNPITTNSSRLLEILHSRRLTQLA